jgi:hypothetical protein
MITAPKPNAPEVNAPEVNAPEVNAPEVNAPEVNAPEVNAPEVKATVPTLMPGDDGTPDDAATRNLPTEQDYMDDPAIDAQIKSMDSYLSEEFDAMFETPDGAYKPDIFSAYEPKGKTIEDSADYTDDPEVLAGMFSDQELVLALRDAVLPLDGEDAPGRGALEFSDGPEFVPAEALYLAIDKKSGKGDMSLASIYDMELDPNREMTNADRIAMFEEDAKIDPLGGNEIKMPTTRDAEVLKAVERNKEIGKPTKAQRATDLMLNHKEQNQSIIDIADDLIAKQDDGLGYDSFNLQDTLVQYLPWSVSNDPNEREAFRGLWGMMMSLDGGSSNEELTPESLADPEAFRTIIYNSLLEIHGGDDTIAMDSYNELVDNFGGMPEFVAGKEAIANGKDDLSSDTSAAAFYRLVATSAKPNEKSIYRSIGVRNDDPLLEKYTTEGSLFGMDARSFTSTNITDGSLSSKLFYPAGSGESRIIFEIAPGETKSIDASTISWFAGENEQFSFGNFEVVSVAKQAGLGGNPEYVVKVRNTDTKDVAAPIAEGISYSGIEDWKKVGGQMGSNVGGTFEDPNGNQYYVKIPKSPSHAQNESLASALYKEAGIEAVEVNLGFSDGELRTISPLIPNSSTDLQTKLGDAEYMKKLQEGFAVDAWLANWDVAGLTFDNVITDGNGNPVRVDPGGALMWRAQGAPKGKLFGDKVNEIDSLRDPDLNPTSAEVFGSMTDADISDSAAKLAGITPERIDSIVDSIVTDPTEAATLKERLKKRRDDILKRFAPKDKILNENTPLPIEEDPNAPQPPSDPNDVNAMNEYKGALADYEVNKAVSDVWDCPPGGLTAAGDKTCTTPSVDDLIDNVTSKVDAVGVADNSGTADKIIDDVIDFIDQVQSEELKPSTKKKAQDIADELTAIREGLKDGSITNDQAIARLNTLSDSIPVGGTSDDANTLEVIGETIDDYRRILDGSFEDRPFGPSYPPAGSGSKGYAKDKTTFLTIGKRVRNKWGYAGTVDRYDKNSWQVWVTMDIDPSGQFAPGYKKMSFSTKTLDVIPEGGDDSPWIDLPGTPEGKKPKTGITPTKLPPKGSAAEKYSKEVADKIAKSGKTAKPPKAEAPQGAPEAPKDFKLTVSDIKDKEKNQIKSTTDKALIAQYKDVLDKNSDTGKAVTEYVNTSAGINITTSELSSGNDERKKEHVDFVLSRGQTAVDKALEETNIANILTDAIDNAPGLANETILYRSVKSEQGQQILGLAIGEEFVSNGFSSTSIDKNKAMFIFNAMDENKALMVIAAPPETKGLYIDARDEKDKMREFEFLLQRGTKFRVVDRDKTKGPYGEVDRVYVEIVSQETPNVIDTSALTGPAALPDTGNAPETSKAPAVPEPTVTMKGKVTGTGMPKITVKEPLSFDYTAYKDVPSLKSAIESLSDTNVQFAKVRGSSALFDSGDIEDLEVRLEGIVGEDGKEHMRVTYKLTSWAGDNLVKSMETEGTWDSKNGIGIPRTSVDPATGAILVRTSVYGQYDGSGTTYTADLGDTKITLRRANDKKHALHNYVTIDLPYNASDDDIKSAMEVGGITDVRPATSTDFTVLAENRLMSIFGSHTDASKNLKLPSVREKTLSDIESKYGITASDVFVTVGPGGQIETRIPDAVAQKIAEKTGAKYLIHNFNMTGLVQTAAANKGVTDINALSPGQKEQLLVEGIVDFLTGARGGGLMSTRTRWFNGIPLTGMSSDSDMKTGGADYVFFTPKNSIGYKHNSGTYGNSEAELMFDAAKLYTRLDWYANYNDEYGKRGASKNVIENARVGAYEVMFKKRVGLESLESMAVNRELRDKVLVELEKQGIKEIHGKPIAEAIVIAGSPNDPTGAELAQYTPLNNTVAYLTSKMQMEKMGYIEQQKYLNSVFDYKYTYPPTTTNVIAAKPDLSSLLTVDGISGVYYYYNADGTRTKVTADEVQGIINSLGKDGSDLKVFKLTPLASMETIKNAFAKYQSGEITAEQFANALIAAQWGAPTWSASVEINSILKSNPEVWDLFKKIVKGSK